MTDAGELVDGPDPAGADEGITAPAPEPAAELAAILDQYMSDLNAGRIPDRARLLDAHPALATQLEACLAGIDFIHRATGSPAPEPSVLGEFRIIREIGRGGMGVVYEAEQTSLHRRVALKVLRLGVVADQEAMQRFRREAETVARLHHTNIVPIFAVGCERGVHFYAMQFIEGKSLALVLAESERSRKLPSPDDVARWGLQAAEALSHSHQRGVIHRDVKPSNLLLDAEGVLWLTDFGLAKRADEVTLTVRGALLGTPRYMSPEQAESLERPIDHRTDLYSLGASLYELATGHPVFDSPAPHAVIAQILTQEPARPRRLRPLLPRDLESIILTCLAKVPSDRYQSAQALAADLRAVLECRPIKRRRQRATERIVRFVRSRRKVLGAGAIGMAATLLLLLGATLLGRSYVEWQMGRVVLTNNGPPLTAQVLAESHDEAAGEPFDVVGQSALSLPAGDYRLRVTGHGRLGRTYRFAVNRGETVTHALSLDEGRLLGGEPDTSYSGRPSRSEQPIPFARITLALELASRRADFVEWTGQTLLRRDAITGKIVWDALHPPHPRKPEHDPASWILSPVGSPRSGMLVNAAPDFDGDGTGDVIWVSTTAALTVAISGKDGGTLWAFAPEIEAAVGPQPKISVTHIPTTAPKRTVQVNGQPLLAEIDGDKTPDLIATMIFYESAAETAARVNMSARTGGPSNGSAHGRRVILTISGQTGRLLWSYPVEKTFSSLSGDSWSHMATLVHGVRSSVVGIIDDTTWIGLDARTGRPIAGPHDIGFTPFRQVQHADLDGDGEPEILALGPGLKPGQHTMAALSCRSGRKLWTATVKASYQRLTAQRAESAWPLILDVDEDGLSEVVVPDSGPTSPRGGFRGIRMLDGRSGQPHWTRPMQPQTKADDGLVQILDVPDLDGDGSRDIVTVSVFEGRDPSSWSTVSAALRAARNKTPHEPVRVFVDAISGKDGHSLWCWQEDNPFSYFASNSRPILWGRGPDGWPLLAVALDPKRMPKYELGDAFFPSSSPAIHMLEMSTGRELHTLEGLNSPAAADFDGDGVDDLWGNIGGHLQAFHGEAPEAWRALGRFSPANVSDERVLGQVNQPAADFDGDGVADTLLGGPTSRVPNGLIPFSTAICRSGSDGHLLWKSELNRGEYPFDYESGHGFSLSTFPLPAGDFDGDGTADVVVKSDVRSRTRVVSNRKATLPILALSGRTGRHLWNAGPLPLGFAANGYSAIQSVDVRRIDPSGAPDLVVRHDSPFVAPGSKVLKAMFAGEPRLARVSGRDGRVIWDIPLATDADRLAIAVPPAAFGDLDGDGALETVQAIPPRFPGGSEELELLAVSLRDGKLLWRHSIQTNNLSSAAVAIGDLDSDGHPEVVAMVQGPGAHVVVTTIHGEDGNLRWTWSDCAHYQTDPEMVLADLDDIGNPKVCVAYAPEAGTRRIVTLNSAGGEVTHRDLSSHNSNILRAADLDGDGRDELLLFYNDRLHAWGAGLKDVWSSSIKSERLEQIVTATRSRHATIIVEQAFGLDGMSGQSRWVGQPSLRPPAFKPTLLDPGNTKRQPLFISEGLGATVCRVALSTDASGIINRTHGAAVPPRIALNDPRWTRPLPWMTGRLSTLGLREFLFVLGLAFFNVVVPLAILRVAARRRPLTVRVLMALPVAAAVPLMALIALTPTFEARANPWIAYAKLEILMATLAGISLLALASALCLALARRRWKSLGRLSTLLLLSTIAAAGGWLVYDMRSMPAIEHYGFHGWYFALVPGAFAAGTLLLFAWLIRRVLPSAGASVL
jgi:tRNA A-37 threonylcarbamoyl transferase component Bud32/outer membrane protein assembly factor BamB